MTAVSDNFNRADGGLGSNWTTQTGANNPAIVSNTVQDPATDDIDAIAFYSAAAFGNDQKSQLELVSTSGSTPRGFGVCLRGLTDAITHYFFVGLFNHSLGRTSQIGKVVAGSATILAFESATTWVATDILAAQVRGTNLTLFRNGVVLLTAVDSAIAAGGAGLNIFVEAGGATSDLAADNWAANDFVLTDYTKFPKPKIRDAALRGQL